MAKRYRVALIGCGGIAQLHAKSLVDMEDVELVGIAEIRPDALASFGDEYGVPDDLRFANADDLCDASRPDVVVIATRADAHAKLSIDALNRGIHVLCEKPIAVDLIEADAMIAASERTGAKLAINTQRHTDPVFVHAKKLIEDGFIGELRALRSECKTYTAAVGMMNIGAHLFDAMGLLAGGAEWVFARLTVQDGQDAGPDDVTTGDREVGLALGDLGTVMIGYEHGVTGTSEYWEGPGTYGVEIAGTEGMLAIRGSDPVILHTEGSDGKVSAPVTWQTIDVPLTDAQRHAYSVNRWATHNMMRALFHAVETDSVPACSGDDGREALEISVAAFVSAMAGRRVGLPLADRTHPLSR